LLNLFQNDDQSWRYLAECDGVEDPDIFFPPRDKALYSKIAAEAKSYCKGDGNTLPCPVRLDCLWEAVQTEEPYGIWGGMSHRERNALVRKWQRKYRTQMTLKEYIFQLDTGEQDGIGPKKVS